MERDAILAKLTEEEVEWLIDHEYRGGQRVGWGQASDMTHKLLIDAAKDLFATGQDRSAKDLRSLAENIKNQLDTIRKGM